MLDANVDLHFYFNPELKKTWTENIEDYTGKKTGIKLYGEGRSKETKTWRTIPVGQTNLDAVLKEISGGKPPEIHHLLFKAKYPEYAVQPANLLLTQRSERESVYGPGQHELMHMVSTGNHQDKFKELLPQFTELYRDKWIKDKGLKTLFTLHKQ